MIIDKKPPIWAIAGDSDCPLGGYKLCIFVGFLFIAS